MGKSPIAMGSDPIPTSARPHYGDGMTVGRGRRASVRLAIGLAMGLAAVLAGGPLSACTRQVAGPSLVLRLATPDDSSDPTTTMQVRHFTEAVNALSHSTIHITPVPDADAGSRDWDQVVARGVAHGTWELGLVPGRAWDELGVRSLRALNAPFLVTSPAALEAVLNDEDARHELLAGLPAAGVVGLDVLPDGMRHPFGYDAPLLGVSDYQGATIRAARSATVAALFTALGASVTDAFPADSQRGAESEFSTTLAGIATGNITFFAKTDVLVANSDARRHLRDDQWAVLREAAAATRSWMFAQQPSDFEAAAAFCAHGGEVVAASPQQVGEVQAAGARVTAQLRADAGSRRLIDRIRSLVAGVPSPQPVTRCPGATGAGTEGSGGAGELARLNGVYRADVTAQALRTAGVDDEDEIRQNVGRYTWTLHNGTWTDHQESDSFVANPDGTGRYTYRNGVFTLYWTTTPGNWTRARLRVTGAGTIYFTDVVDGQAQSLAEGFFARPWTRIGTDAAPG